MKNTNENAVRNEKANGITELVFILDRSGSMSGLESDTVGGFNSVIDEQRKKDGRVYVSAVLFNHESYVLYDRVDIDRIEKMKESDFAVGGSTALIDALGGAIHHIGNVHKYARKEDVPENTIFVIMTDSMENASRVYSSDKVKQMVERQQNKYGWQFLFLGANIDAVETARSYGIDRRGAVRFESDSLGHKLNYRAVSKAVSAVRECGDFDESWAEEIKQRGEKKEKR
ncbi:MAG: VWA domain-containing protein [Clostridia bacterium]|nr:VWA domain-containing protein [Clostridia bacterium]